MLRRHLQTFLARADERAGPALGRGDGSFGEAAAFLSATFLIEPFIRDVDLDGHLDVLLTETSFFTDNRLMVFLNQTE